MKPNADYELLYLKSLPDWESRWHEAVHESDIGGMPEYPDLPCSSGILLRHAAILAWWQNRTRLDIISRKTILEFGGGHGSMCRLIHRLGFTGTYIIYDLPAVSLLQQYYLQENGIEGVISVSDFDSLTAEVAETDAKDSLFIATWSLSESPFSIRDALLPIITDFDSVLIASQMQVRDMDNVEYFQQWQDYFSDMEWHRKDVRKVMWLAGAR